MKLLATVRKFDVPEAFEFEVVCLEYKADGTFNKTWLEGPNGEVLPHTELLMEHLLKRGAPQQVEDLLTLWDCGKGLSLPSHRLEALKALWDTRKELREGCNTPPAVRMIRRHKEHAMKTIALYESLRNAEERLVREQRASYDRSVLEYSILPLFAEGWKAPFAWAVVSTPKAWKKD